MKDSPLSRSAGWEFVAESIFAISSSLQLLKEEDGTTFFHSQTRVRAGGAIPVVNIAMTRRERKIMKRERE